MRGMHELYCDEGMPQQQQQFVATAIDICHRTNHLQFRARTFLVERALRPEVAPDGELGTFRHASLVLLRTACR